MNAIRKGRYPGPERMLALSFLCHALVFLLVLKLQLYPHPPRVESPSYYVDLVNLPVASPQAGTPGPPAPKAAPQPVPPAAPAAPVFPMRPAAPKGEVKATKPPPAPATKGKPAPAAHESSHDFDERLAKLAQAADARRMDDVMARLKKGGGKVGIPGGTGTQAGSDYSSYIQSRLRDAFRSTIASDTPSPKVAIRLTIGSDGRALRIRIEQSTGDHVFEEAVVRAVHLAEKTFTPPPAGAEFEQGFVFKPQGVNVR